ncbi:MBL fold metallo-hydrolase [Roseovarius sp. ZX-A-9]|uniref:MBL fold metallo-hydrolase n=1 Tax=Roseovarius sp. ZX-A-9 TaxID=3014783 RepID=UPI00232C21CB|nr:MBL fold metallo-hydrolase [Roseovarius sp. ZX-A-9]
MPHLTRRTLLTAAVALPLARAAGAAAPMLGASGALHRRVKLGAFEVTTLLAASAARPDPHSIFGLNVDYTAFRTAAEAALLPVDMAQFFFTPTIVNTGTELVLFDTGLNAEGITAALAAAGYTPDQIDVVVITHMHGDHIGGLRTDETATFPNARYVTGAREFDAWAGMQSDAFETKMRPLAEKTTMITPGQTVTSGITAVEAFGHTPGHMAYMLESEGASLLLAVDFANHYVFSLGYPDWEVKFDMDKSAAAATRRRLLDMLSAERIPFIGYHMPFPAIGYVEARGDGFRYLPESYQLRL